MASILKVGIISKEDYRQRTIAIAKGEYVPMHDEPKVWYESLLSMAQMLSNEGTGPFIGPRHPAIPGRDKE
jgi:predicted transcriptional regulator